MPLELAKSNTTQLRPVIMKISTLENIQKTDNSLTNGMKPHLEDRAGTNRIQDTLKIKSQGVRPKADRSRRRATKECEKPCSGKISSLLDLVAVSVVKNHTKLKKMYQRKCDTAWKMVNSNKYKGAMQEQCYETLRDLNKKRKLLRAIESENITEEVVAELYQDVDIFLREKHVYETVNIDFFKCASQWSMAVIATEFN